MIVMIEKSDGSALCHIGDSDHKISVLSGGSAALLRRIAREPGAGAHPVRLFYASGYPGAYVHGPPSSLPHTASRPSARRCRHQRFRSGVTDDEVRIRSGPGHG
jgi:hypothetical protein